MNKLFNNEDGVSLVELLATLVIGTFIMVFIISIHIFIQNQYKSQSAEVKQLTDITIAAKAITKDIRSANEILVSGDLKEITLIFKDETITYKFEKEQLRKNDVTYIYDLKNFEVEMKGSKISLEIKSKSGKKIETEILVREGDNEDDQPEDE